MMKTGQKEGEEFAKEIFPNFIKSEVRERCFRYINKNIPIRREKSWNGYMEVVDVINSLYEIKEGIN